MDLAVPKLRYAALCALVKAFRPGLSVRFVAAALGFIAAGGRHARDEPGGAGGRRSRAAGHLCSGRGASLAGASALGAVH